MPVSRLLFSKLLLRVLPVWWSGIKNALMIRAFFCVGVVLETASFAFNMLQMPWLLSQAAQDELVEEGVVYLEVHVFVFRKEFDGNGVASG